MRDGEGNTKREWHVEGLELDEVLPMRTRQFRPLLVGIKPHRQDLDDDPDTRHFGVRHDDGRLLAVGTFYRDPCPEVEGADAFRLFGFVVREDWRGRGLGALLFERATVALSREFPEADLVWGNAEVEAIEFWEAIGCEPIGEPYEARGKQHVVTVHPLGRELLESRGRVEEA